MARIALIAQGTAAVVASAALTACGANAHYASNAAGKQTPPTTATASPAATQATPAPSVPASAPASAPAAHGGAAQPAGSTCRSGDMRAAVTEDEPGAGQRYATLSLRNVGSSSCTIGGWPRLVFAGNGAPTTASRTGTPMMLTLPPAGRAYSTLHWSVIPGAGEPQSGACEAAPNLLYIYPPGQTTPRAAAWPYGAVCEKGAVDVTAFRSSPGA